MKKHFIQAAICAALLISAIPARADFIASATLNAAQELNPLTGAPPVSSATGSFTLDYSTTANDFTYTLTYSGLTSPTTMAHIHFGLPGQTGAPIFTLYDYGMPPSTSMTSNTMTGTLTVANFMPDSVDGISTMAQAVADIEAGDMYVNVHSTNYPDGEIRGQLLVAGAAGDPAPEPASIGLLLFGGVLGGAGLLRRRAARQ